MSNANTQWVHHKTWCHFNVLDLHETLRTLSRCHHFGHKNCTLHTSNAKHNGHTTKHGVNSTCWICTKHCAHWVDVITSVIKCHAGFARNITLTESMSSLWSQELKHVMLKHRVAGRGWKDPCGSPAWPCASTARRPTTHNPQPTTHNLQPTTTTTSSSSCVRSTSVSPIDSNHSPSSWNEENIAHTTSNIKI